MDMLARDRLRDGTPASSLLHRGRRDWKSEGRGGEPAAHGAPSLSRQIRDLESEVGVALLPISIRDYLPASVVSIGQKGEQPTVDLVIGYRKANTSPIGQMFP
jgi:hypothetical protein